MTKKGKAWIASGSVLVSFVLLLLAAIAAHVAGIADAEAQDAASTQSRCSAGAGLDLGTARIAQQVRAALAGGGAGSVEVAGLSSPGEQIPLARVIVATAIQLRVSARGQVIALATALQESGLRNLDYGDRDSLGLFQQRPSQGWGTRKQILDPVYASTKLYKALTALEDWEFMPLTVAAQKVQASAYPDAYAPHEPLATALQMAIGPTLGAAPPRGLPITAGPGGAGSGGAGCPGAGDTGWGTIPAGSLPVGYRIPATAPVPVQSAIRWALGQLGTPYQWGGSCTNPHGNDVMGRCDCSSLMQRAYGTAGIEISRTTYTQVKEGSPVPANAVLPGDLVFSRGSAPVPEHVAMSIGGGLVVHAPRPGRVVAVFRLDMITILSVRRVAP